MLSLIALRELFFKSDREGQEKCRGLFQKREEVLYEFQDLIKSTDVASIEIHPEELIIRTQQGVRLEWQIKDSCYAPSHMVITGAYETEEAALMRDAVRGANVAFDIGANVGFYCLEWAQEMPKSGKIHVFEPTPNTYSQLLRNITLNSQENIIEVNNYALSDAPGSMQMFLPDYPGPVAASLMKLHPDKNNIEIKVQVDTLDHYFKSSKCKSLDMLKADVEGAELSVIKGGMNTISEHMPIMFLELLRKWSKPYGYHPNDVIALLADLGYICYAQENGKLAVFETMDDETIHKNFFFAHPDKHKNFIQRNIAP